MANVVMFIALAGGFAFAITPAQDALCLLFGSWVRTTATAGQKAITGQNTALKQCSLLHGIRNCGGIMGFPICVVGLWNFTATNLGTTKNLQVSLVRMRCLLRQRLSVRLELI